MNNTVSPAARTVIMTCVNEIAQAVASLDMPILGDREHRIQLDAHVLKRLIADSRPGSQS